MRLPLVLVAVVAAACSGNESKTPVAPSASVPAPAAVRPTVQTTVRGTVLDEAGVPVGGATVAFSGAPQLPTPSTTVMTDPNGNYEVTVASSMDFYWGRADRASYESTYRPSYFAANPGVLNFRLFQPVRIAAGDSVHIAVTADGPICGYDDEWFCRTVRVRAGSPGILSVQAVPDDPSIPAVAAIQTPGGGCCPEPTTVAVSPGNEVIVYVELAWNKPVTGVTLNTSIR